MLDLSRWIILSLCHVDGDLGCLHPGTCFRRLVERGNGLHIHGKWSVKVSMYLFLAASVNKTGYIHGWLRKHSWYLHISDCGYEFSLLPTSLARVTPPNINSYGLRHSMPTIVEWNEIVGPLHTWKRYIYTGSWFSSIIWCTEVLGVTS